MGQGRSATNVGLLRILPTTLFAMGVMCSGCQDRYQEGYQVGFADASSQASACKAELDRCNREKNDAQTTGSHSFYSGSVVTEVCGGNGLNLNGRHIRPGKTGCVRAYSDGRVERY